MTYKNQNGNHFENVFSLERSIAYEPQRSTSNELASDLMAFSAMAAECTTEKRANCSDCKIGYRIQKNIVIIQRVYATLLYYRIGRRSGSN